MRRATRPTTIGEGNEALLFLSDQRTSYRFDLRQFLYNTKWTRQFKTIDEYVKVLPTPPTSSAPIATGGADGSVEAEK